MNSQFVGPGVFHNRDPSPYACGAGVLGYCVPPGAVAKAVG